MTHPCPLNVNFKIFTVITRTLESLQSNRGIENRCHRTSHFVLWIWHISWLYPPRFHYPFNINKWTIEYTWVLTLFLIKLLFYILSLIDTLIMNRMSCTYKLVYPKIFMLLSDSRNIVLTLRIFYVEISVTTEVGHLPLMVSFYRYKPLSWLLENVSRFSKRIDDQYLISDNLN